MEKRQWAVAAALLIATPLVALLASCNDDDVTGPSRDQLVARGNYLVNHASACVDCHTPRLPTGAPDTSKRMAGGFFADLDPSSPERGAIYAPNLTSDATGLRGWSDEQIKTAFLNGYDDEGQALFPIMPYYVFHNMSDQDADAIVAYLRSLPPIQNEIPERQPLPFPFTEPSGPISPSDIPQTTLSPGDPHYANAMRGMYLAAQVGACIECHTPSAGPNPVDPARFFAGGKDFGIGAPFPDVVYSANITPDPTGIAGMTPEQVVTALHTGVDHKGGHICPPMPVGPNGAYSGITDQDALDIGWYLTTIRPIANTVPDCAGPGGP